DRGETQPREPRGEPGARAPRPERSCARCRWPAARSSNRLGLAITLLGDLFLLVDLAAQLVELALGPRQPPGHDRDIYEDQGHEHDVRAGDVLARAVEGERWGGDHEPGHDGAALLPKGRTASSPKTLRRNARSCMRLFLAAISYFHRVTNSSAIAARATRNVSRMEPGSLPPVSVRTRGWMNP